MNILIVEDDPSFAQLLKLRLNAWQSDATLFEAGSISAATLLLEDNPPSFFSLVILDQHLPDGMGPSLLSHPSLERTAVMALSAESAPELPAAAVSAGAHHFLNKTEVSSAHFIQLLDAVLAKAKLETKTLEAKIRTSQLKTVRTLIETLQHEINNPLGAVIGASYLVRASENLTEEQRKAVALIEQSSHRIKEVMQALAEAITLEEVTKGRESVFHVPGDPDWKE